ncbi:MAG: hypothetical protein JNM14_08355 [Ferruginibacter sp.]|nr:hypothetical protein [Ferruginibacter sp.]
MAKILTVLIVACGLQMSATAQENSPYSRYGLGDLTPNHNIFTRGMGGISAGVAEFITLDPIPSKMNTFKLQPTNSTGINFTNPASLSTIGNTVFDVGVDVDYRILKSTNPAKKFTSANTYVSYLQLAFPLATAKMRKKDIGWGMSLGLKPVSRISYKIQENRRGPNITDSISSLKEGSGGVNQAFLGTGLKIKNFSIGINAGYMFGSKDISVITQIVNDSMYHYASSHADKTTIGGFFINGGIQYDLPLARKGKDITKNLRIGVYGNLQQNLNASNDLIRETVIFDANGNQYRIDSVYENNVEGNIRYPAMLAAGAVYQDANWLIGADFEYGNWAGYRYYDQTDQVQNNWTLRLGTQYFPAKEGKATSRYFNFVKYRAGFYYGPDYIKSTGVSRPEYGFSIGTGMPLTSVKRPSYMGGYVVLNTALEFGSRGNKQTNLRENLVRFSIGVSMNARWFQKPKYN